MPVLQEQKPVIAAIWALSSVQERCVSPDLVGMPGHIYITLETAGLLTIRTVDFGSFGWRAAAPDAAIFRVLAD